MDIFHRVLKWPFIALKFDLCFQVTTLVPVI